MNITITKVSNAGIVFSNGQSLYSSHEQGCCEQHYLSFEHLSIKDFEGMEFDLDGDFFEKVENYGIRLKPLNGHPVAIPGYGINNGYYSTELTLVLSGGNKPEKQFDITTCQDVSG